MFGLFQGANFLNALIFLYFCLVAVLKCIDLDSRNNFDMGNWRSTVWVFRDDRSLEYSKNNIPSSNLNYICFVLFLGTFLWQHCFSMGTSITLSRPGSEGNPEDGAKLENKQRFALCRWIQAINAVSCYFKNIKFINMSYLINLI